jgi:hypothetical protein
MFDHEVRLFDRAIFDGASARKRAAGERLCVS